MTTEFLEIALRWAHFVAGITWIGLLYFFNLVNVPFMKALDGPTKGKVVPVLMPKALWYFRHAAWVTVLVGFIYWAFMIVPGDPAGNAGVHRTVVVWLLVSALAWLAVYGILTPLKGALNKGPVLAVLIGVVALVQACLLIHLIGVEGHSARTLSIAVGGGFGLVMMLNVWGIIWRHQKKIIAWTADNAAKGTPVPPESAMLARRSFLASRTNTWLSLPMLFFMATASHGATIVGPLFGIK